MDQSTVDQFASTVKAELGLHSFTLSLRANGELYLAMLAVPKESRKQGLGSQAMERLVQFADANGLRVVLTTGVHDPHWGTTSQSRLITFYKRFGFVHNSGRHKDFAISGNMYREPKMKKQSFREFYNANLTEAPIGDYQTFGDWNKRASFHSKRDRTIIRHPRAIEITKKKFDNNHHIFNLYFLNHKEDRDNRGQFMELGRRDINWVRQNLGDEIANAVEPNVGQEGHVNVIFTNNDGDERKAMTAWIMAHRIAHACARPSGNRGNEFPSYKEAANTIAWHMSVIMDEYGMADYPDSDDKLSGRNSYGRSDRERQSGRVKQQMMTQFFQQVCTFKSARDGKIRDYFEILHELFAQYITTGKMKFNPAPKSFGSKQAFGNGTGIFHLRGNAEDVDGHLHSLAQTLEYYFDEMLDDVGESILIM